MWPVKLPDLISRLKAMPVATLGLPDDDLLRGVLVKLFADRQVKVDEAVSPTSSPACPGRLPPPATSSRDRLPGV